MSSAKQSEPISRSGTPRQNERVRQLILYGAVLLGVFLLGLAPMWIMARERARERDTARAALRISSLQNTLANAAIDAKRGDYEPARQAVSEFFTNVTAEFERGRDSVFNEAQQSALRSILDTRDDAITLLARSDPASVERLVEFYYKYRLAVAGAPPR